MIRGLVLGTMFAVAVVVSDACLAQQKPDQLSERLQAEQIHKLEERFSREAAGRKDDAPLRETDIEALLLILNREKTKGVRTTRYIQVLEALGRFPDNHSAVRALVNNIDEFEIHAPTLTHDPLEHYTAAPALSKCGAIARREILISCRNELTERKLHMMAHVLMLLDRDEELPFPIEITVHRLMRELRRPEGRTNFEKATAEVYGKNLRRMIYVMLDPLFSAKDFPLDSAVKNVGIEPSAKSK